MDNLIEQLGLQSEAFCASFNTLSRAKNIEDLAKNFFQVLQGNLHVENAVILQKSKKETDWNLLFCNGKQDNGFADILNVMDGNGIAHIKHPQYKVSAIHPLNDQSAFGLLLGNKNNGAVYNEFDIIVLQFYLQQLEIVYGIYESGKKEKQLIFELNHRVLQLNSLIDTSIDISRLQEGSQLLHLSLERVLALTNAAKGMLRIKKGNKVLDKIFYPFAFKSKKMEQEKYKITASFRFAGKVYTFYLFEKESREGRIDFDTTDQLLLDAFARQVHVSLENRFLYEESLEKERIDSEISLAGSIQKNLIPEKLPQIEGYDQCGINIPTKHVGGDYYDCIPLKDGRFLFIIADVSGKGVAAALLVSTLQASVHAYSDGPFELESLVQKLNEVIHDASTDEKYITAIFALLDPESGVLTAVNAGHNPAYILRKNKTMEELKTGGIPLGMLREDFPYQSSELVLHTGDRLLFYTDGVTEAMNENLEEYDLVRPLRKFFTSRKASTAKNFIDDLMADVQDFTGDTPQSDDITALYLARDET